MNLLVTFVPILLFIGAYKLFDIYIATFVLMVSTSVLMGIMRLRDGKLSGMHQFTLALILGLGSLTQFLQDERYIKWKPSVVYVVGAAAMAFALFVKHKNFTQMAVGDQLKLPEPVWYRLNVAFICFFLFMGAANGYVAAFYSTDAWVNFKLWGYMFPLVFFVGMFVYLMRHLKEDEEPAP